VNNVEISWIFLEIADLLEIKGDNPYKIRSYRKAAHMLSTLDQKIQTYWKQGKLRELPGIGPALAAKIDELLKTGNLTYLNNLREEVPIQLRQLLVIPGIGPRTVHTLYRHLGITSLEQLKAAVLAQQLRRLPGLGTKSELAIKRALTSKEYTQGMPLGNAFALASDLAEALAQLPEVINIELAGEIRRREELVHEAILLFVTQADKALPVLTTFCSAPYVREILESDSNSAVVQLGIGLQARLVAVRPAEFVTQLCYHTGPTDHWTALVVRAKQHGLALSPTALKDKNEALVLESEHELYRYLGLDFIIPELRQGKNELSAAAGGTLPKSISIEQIKGDLHLHSNWSDGRESIFSMAEAASKRGYDYIAITDHSQRLKIARGLNAQELAAQLDEISIVRAQFPELMILAGVEVDILKDGRLDLSNEVLAQLDIVIAAVHSGFNQDEKTMTQRIITALRNPNVHILAHPSGRLLAKRPPYRVNLDTVLKEAGRQGKILEINSSTDRLDLNANWAAKAKKLGIKLAINTDAHDVQGLSDMEYGVSVARRAGLEPSDVVNCWPTSYLLEHLRSIRGVT